MTAQISPSRWARHQAMDSRVEQAAQGLFPGQASPLAAATPMRRPVKEPGRHGDELHRVQGGSAVVQQGYGHGHEGAGVGQAIVLEGLGNQSLILTQRHRAGGGGGLQGQYFHASVPPVMVMMRCPSPTPRRMSTRSTPSSSASLTISLHSTAHTPPRAR